MSDNSEKKYTEKDLILAKREGYVRGARQFDMRGNTDWTYNASAKGVFQLPKITRPRVVRTKDYINDRTYEVQWRVRDGVLEAQENICGEWRKGLSFQVTPARVRVWSDLLANPTETVEDDA